MALGLGLGAGWFAGTVTADPLTCCSASSATRPRRRSGWGVAEHTDYGLLTLLAQDGNEGLEVRTPTAGWRSRPDPDVLVVNLGDMLERMTGGRYRSTPHRVRNTGDVDRLSFPCFVDPSWDAVRPVLPLGDGGRPTAAARWDDGDPQAWTEPTATTSRPRWPVSSPLQPVITRPGGRP